MFHSAFHRTTRFKSRCPCPFPRGTHTIALPSFAHYALHRGTIRQMRWKGLKLQ